MMRRAQPASHSFLEACTNVALGFVLALVTQELVYPLFGIRTSFTANSTIAVIFTAVSLARSYLVRRAFETFDARAESPSLHPTPSRSGWHARP